jgi:hypothetical protein
MVMRIGIARRGWIRIDARMIESNYDIDMMTSEHEWRSELSILSLFVHPLRVSRSISWS